MPSPEGFPESAPSSVVPTESTRSDPSTEGAEAKDRLGRHHERLQETQPCAGSREPP